jgi:hypothetical protein
VPSRRRPWQTININSASERTCMRSITGPDENLTVLLDCPEVGGDLLVELACRHAGEHLAFAPGKAGEAVSQLRGVIAQLTG